MELIFDPSQFITERGYLAFEMIVFDFDGTIVDWQPQWQLMKNELSTFFRETYNYDSQFTPLYETLDIIDDLFGSKARKEALDIVTKYELVATFDAKVIPQTKEMIDRLRSSGMKMAIFSSNSRRAIETALKKLGILHLFEMIIGIEDVGKCKPDPDGFHKILQKSHATKNRVLFIGNAQSDLEAGRRAGIKTVLIGKSTYAR